MARRRRLPRTEVHVRNEAASPLGHITLAATGIRQHLALRKARTFGQYALVYILDGRGSYSDDQGAQRQVESGDIILVFPDVAHLYNPLPGTSWVTTYLCFQGPLFDLWRKDQLLSPRQPILHAEPVTTWSRHLTFVIDASRQTGPHSSLRALCRLQQVLADLLCGAGEPRHYEADATWLDKVCGMIEAQLGEAPDWPLLARQMSLNVDKFRKRFSRTAGQPLARYRQRRQIDRACELMQGHKMKDSEIAEQLGFCDEYYFSRRFKAITGKSPRQFRRDRLLA